jgi:type IV secretion system protein VirD4
MLIALAGLGCLSADVDLAAAPRWLWYFRADPQIARWFKIGVISSLLILLILAVVAALSIRRPLHGAARWAGEAELRRAGLRSSTGIVLGAWGRDLLRFGGSEHVLLYAPTRTGKGVGVVIPNLLSWPQSVIVLDVKRENWIASAGYRAAHGQAVHLFDPFSPDRLTARFNPLGHIPRQNSVATLNELQKIAALLFPTPERGDPFWSEAARTGFIGVGAFVAETPKAPFTLGEIYRQLTRDDPRERLPAAIAARARTGPPLSDPCVNALTDFCSAGENTFASIKQTITSRMGLWLSPDVDWATSASDFDLRALKQQPTSLYLGVSPDNLLRAAPLYALLLQQVIDAQTRRLPEPHESDRQLLIVLDEFARLGNAPMLAHSFSFVAGYGIRLLAVLQSPSQLRAAYGDHLAEEIIANCGAEVIFAPKDVRIAQLLSERLGYVGQSSFSRSRPLGLGPGRRSISESEQRRALMLPQELIGLPEDSLIVLRSGISPVRGRKLRYYRQRAFMERVLSPPQLRTAHAESLPVGLSETLDGSGLAAERGRPSRVELDRALGTADRDIHRR